MIRPKLKRSLSLLPTVLLAGTALLAPAHAQESPRAASSFSALDPEATKPVADASPKPKKGAAEPGSDGPTEITSDESLFEEKKHMAIFLRNVYLVNTDFTISCDKLTAYMKHADKPKDAAAAKPSTPAPAALPTPKPGVPPRLSAPTPKPTPGPKKDPQDQTSGLDHAFAEGGVVIIQDKVEADGKITHSVAHAKTAFYDANTGDVTLRGKPDITQGINTTVALEESTVMVLNREGHMKSYDGRVTTVLSELSSSTPKPKTADSTPTATPAPR